MYSQSESICEPLTPKTIGPLPLLLAKARHILPRSEVRMRQSKSLWKELEGHGHLSPTLGPVAALL